MPNISYSFWGRLEFPEEAHGTATTEFTCIGERYLVVDEFIKQGCDVVTVQKRMGKQYRNTCLFEEVTCVPEVDLAYFEWRWDQNANHISARKNDTDWDRQVQLLDEYTHRGTPIVVMDADLKLTKADEERWPTMVIGEHSFKPSNEQGRKQRISLLPCTDFKSPKLDDLHVNPGNDYVYVGNDYERDTQFKKYYGEPSYWLRKAGIQTSVYGNWMSHSNIRVTPSENLKKYPHISFPGRISFIKGMKAMNNAICVTAIAKDEYARRGFIAPRVYESLLCGTPILIPQEHHAVKSMGLENEEYVVNNQADVCRCVRRIQRMCKEERADVVSRQVKALRSLGDFSPEAKVKKILSYIKK